MKILTALVCVGVVGVLGYALLREHDRRVQEAAMAHASQDSLMVAIGVEREQAQSRYTADSLASLRAIQARDQALRGARQEADSFAAVTRRLGDSLKVMVPAALVDYVDRLLLAWDVEHAARERERLAADSALGERDVRITQLEATYAVDMSGVREQLAEAVMQLNRANQRSSPSLWRRAVQTLPWVAGALVVGRLTQ
jgi:hypothetical protein